MTRSVFFFVIVGLSNLSVAQVQNNNILDRLTLELNAEPVFSSTAKSTVEWKCINKALTNKCLVYHNDQWFSFSVPRAGTYFINISNQKCKDLRGLQLIIIEGNPCETTTYRILQCIPQIRQEDAFVQLDSLKSNIQYLINVDGFLEDFCEFDIQISERPNGLPRTFQSFDTVKSELSLKGRLVNLSWAVGDERIDQFQSFQIYRANSTNIKSDFIQDQPVLRNTYGAYILTYSAIDSLGKEGRYTYRVFGLNKRTQIPFLLATKIVVYAELKPKEPKQRSALLTISFKNKMPIKILVYDATTHLRLLKQEKEFDETHDNMLKVDLAQFIDQGVKKFEVLVTDLDARKVFEFYYKVDNDGNLLLEQ